MQNGHRILRTSLFSVVASLLLVTSPALAEDVLYYILCDCDPSDPADRDLEISTQVSPHAAYGGSPGFEAGDEVII